MSMSTFLKSHTTLSRRRLRVAGVAAFIGCAACCAIPLLAAAGVGSGALATLASVLRPGSEFVVGGVVFLTVLSVMAIRNRIRRRVGAGCGPACDADGGCCNQGVRPALSRAE